MKKLILTLSAVSLVTAAASVYASDQTVYPSVNVYGKYKITDTFKKNVISPTNPVILDVSKGGPAKDFMISYGRSDGISLAATCSYKVSVAKDDKVTVTPAVQTAKGKICQSLGNQNCVNYTMECKVNYVDPTTPLFVINVAKSK